MPVLVGWRQLAVIGLIPLALAASHAGTELFMYNALGTDTANTPAGVMFAVATAGLAMLAIWFAIEVCRPRETIDAPTSEPESARVV